MPELPEHLHPDRSRTPETWARRGILTLCAVPVVLALLGVAGQPEKTHTASAPAATLKLIAPDRLRGGLLWKARIEVRALRPIAHAQLVLAPGFFDGMQFNTMEPAATDEASDDGRVAFSYGPLHSGETLVVYLQLQANATTVGDQDTSVALNDGDRTLARVSHTIAVLP